MATKIRLSIIIPAYNESKNLPVLMKELHRVLNKLNLSYQIIIIDDGSQDQTFQTIKTLKRKYPEIIGIQLRKNSGKSNAFKIGLNHAVGELILTIDSDLQDDPKDIIKIINKLNQGYDVVSGNRTNRNDNISKQISTKLFNMVVSMATGVKLNDYNCGLKIYKKTVTDKIYITEGMHRFMPVLATWQGFKITEVPVTNRSRLHGKSNYGFNRAIKGILDLTTIMFLQKYAQRPLRLFGSIGLMLFFTGFLTGIYLTILRFQGFKIGDRPLLNLTILLLILGVQFFSIGLIGEMVAAYKTTIDNVAQKT